MADAFPLDPFAVRRVQVPTTGRRAFGAPRTGHTHAGVDLVAPRGAVIYAPVSGRVVAVLLDGTRRCGFGVVIDETGTGRRWTLCHFNAAPVVDTGRIDAGVAVGVVGNSGNASTTGPHLHLQAIHIATGEPVDVTGELEDVLRRERGAGPLTSRIVPRSSTLTTARDNVGVVVAVAGAALTLYFLSKRKRFAV